MACDNDEDNGWSQCDDDDDDDNVDDDNGRQPWTMMACDDDEDNGLSHDSVVVGDLW